MVYATDVCLLPGYLLAQPAVVPLNLYQDETDSLAHDLPLPMFQEGDIDQKWLLVPHSNDLQYHKEILPCTRVFFMDGSNDNTLLPKIQANDRIEIELVQQSKLQSGNGLGVQHRGILYSNPASFLT